MKSYNYPTHSGSFFDGMNGLKLKRINKLTWSFYTNCSRPSANGAVFNFDIFHSRYAGRR